MNKEQMRQIENNSGSGRLQLNSIDSYFKYNDQNTQINSHVRLVKKFETQLNIAYIWYEFNFIENIKTWVYSYNAL